MNNIPNILRTKTKPTTALERIYSRRGAGRGGAYGTEKNSKENKIEGTRF